MTVIVLWPTAFTKVAGLTGRFAAGTVIAVEASGTTTAVTRVGDLGKVERGVVFVVVWVDQLNGVEVDLYAGDNEPDIVAPAALGGLSADTVIR